MAYLGKWYVDVYCPIAGWKAVLYGPEGPENTSYFAYKDREGAARYARSWAEAEELPCRACGGAEFQEFKCGQPCNTWVGGDPPFITWEKGE